MRVSSVCGSLKMVSDICTGCKSTGIDFHVALMLAFSELLGNASVYNGYHNLSTAVDFFGSVPL